jgi:CubicO group peptidase (beta-lactamase class C family)
MAGELSSDTWGYGYQWWVPGFPSTDYTAAGVYNQYIYIDPVTNVVIAKTSSNYRFTSERQESKDAHIAMFRAIAQSTVN